MKIQREQATRLIDGAKLLWIADICSDDMTDAGVSIEDLWHEGMRSSDVRWLVSVGFVEQIGTRPPAAGKGLLSRLRIPDQARFRLTEDGVHFVRELVDTVIQDHVFEDQNSSVTPSCSVQRQRIPKWDKELREFWFCGLLVKCFRRPAPAQELILDAFEELEWPVHIDDPLMPQPGIEPKSRLHDSIKRLNNCQLRQLVRFSGNGNGTGIRWEAVDEEVQ